MTIKDKEHYELMDAFEKTFKAKQPPRESKDLWHRSIFYCNGKLNNDFVMFRHGYMLGKSIGTEATQ